jgi:hypothetical protein
MSDDSHDLTSKHISGDEVIGEIIAARAKLAKVQRELAAVTKRLAEIEAQRELAEMATVAKRYDKIPGQSTEARAALLLGVRKSQGKEAYEELLKTFDGTLALIQSGATLGEIGTAAGGDDSEPRSKLEGLAKAYAAEHKVSLLKARFEVAKSNPSLYAEANR